MSSPPLLSSLSALPKRWPTWLCFGKGESEFSDELSDSDEVWGEVMCLILGAVSQTLSSKGLPPRLLDEARSSLPVAWSLEGAYN